jgi:hypothetical protein
MPGIDKCDDDDDVDVKRESEAGANSSRRQPVGDTASGNYSWVAGSPAPIGKKASVKREETRILYVLLL